ncbi:MAG: hypothetical protein M9952_04045 [Microthrixaceae bacterium]|nr:hypothetical protein [Microthrixaceae bacterium]MCO5312094.1 hypothetical protein [Microthrixaceae bacterium]TXI55267.1 MAG: hypothetical protein E6Q57_01065 [Mycobacterium sp.]HPB44507.1 hypothetical protein [Microthrixaceae bacterium]
MIVVDEYLAIRSLVGDTPSDLPDDVLAITTSVHWRILQRLHLPRGGQLSQAMAALSEPGRAAFRRPAPEILEILDPRPLLDQAAEISAAYGGTGLLIAEMLTASLHHGRTLWYGSERNVGRRTRDIARDLGITVNVVT